MVPRIAAEILRANADLVAFFGADRITAGEHEGIQIPLTGPTLVAIKMEERPERSTAGIVHSFVKVEVRAFLPMATPATSLVEAPAAPEVSPSGTTYTYRITAFGASGESYASEPVQSSAIATLTLPVLQTGQTAFRIWRSESSQTPCRWVGTSYESGTWADSASNTTGRELCPVWGQGDRITSLIQQALLDRDADAEYLPGQSQWIAIGGAQIKPLPSRVYAKRNLIVHIVEAVYLVRYTQRTQELT